MNIKENISYIKSRIKAIQDDIKLFGASQQDIEMLDHLKYKLHKVESLHIKKENPRSPTKQKKSKT